MTEMRTTRTRYTLRAISILASALVLVGLGTFAYSAQSSAAAQGRFYQVIAELTANQMQLIAQRDEVTGYLDAAREALALVGWRLSPQNVMRLNYSWLPPVRGALSPSAAL